MTNDDPRLRRLRRDLTRSLHHPRGPRLDVMLVLRDCWITACVAKKRDCGVPYEQAISEVKRDWSALARLGPPLVRTQAESALSEAAVRRAFDTYVGLLGAERGRPRNPRLVHRDDHLAFCVVVLCAQGARYKDAIEYVASAWSALTMQMKYGDGMVSKSTVRRAYDRLGFNRRPGRGRRRHPKDGRVMRLPPPGWKPPEST